MEGNMGGFENKEHKKEFQEVSLTVTEKRMDKGVMMSFNSPDAALTSAYNKAIDTVLKNTGHMVFHQAGSQNQSGYQAWEVWGLVSEEELEDLFGEIDAEARKYYESQ
jgi:hypothetical protein